MIKAKDFSCKSYKPRPCCVGIYKHEPIGHTFTRLRLVFVYPDTAQLLMLYSTVIQASDPMKSLQNAGFLAKTTVL